MTKFLTWMLGLMLIALCTLCVLQWKREGHLRVSLKEVDDRLKAEQENRIVLEEKLAAWEKEIRQLNDRIVEQGAKIAEQELLAASFAKDGTSEKGRADALALELEKNKADLEKAKVSLTEWQEKVVTLNATVTQQNDAIRKQNDSMTAQNAAIEKQNVLLKQLSEERDGSIAKLNAQMTEYNGLMEKYNKLVKTQ